MIQILLERYQHADDGGVENDHDDTCMTMIMIMNEFYGHNNVWPINFVPILS